MSRTINMVGGAGGGIKLASIAITHGPNKTSYRPGQTFDPAGMTVEATLLQRSEGDGHRLDL